MIDPAYVRKNFPSVRPEWLALAREQVLEPALPVIDTHHHLWKLPESTYLRAELADDLDSGHDVRASVFIDCHSGYREDGREALRPVGETEFVVREIEGRHPTACAGIVGWADLTLADFVQDVLEEHVRAGRGRFRGIRSRVAWHAHPEIHPAGLAAPGMLLDPRLQQGTRRLGAMGLTLDVWAYHTQLAEVAQLADACPGTTMILDHCGGPLGVGPFADRRDEVFRDWRGQMVALARRGNVVVKLGGLAMPRTGFQLHERARPAGSEELARLWAPYVQECIEAFGVRRCMFESNFPVDKGACSYRVLWNAFKRLTADLGASERRELFTGTAARVYRLQDKLGPA